MSVPIKEMCCTLTYNYVKILHHPPAIPPSVDTMSALATLLKEPNVRRSKRLQGHKALHSQVTSHGSPYESNDYTDAISSPDAPLWKAAILEEYQSLKKTTPGH